MPRALTHAPADAGARASSIPLPNHQPLTLLFAAAPAIAMIVGLVGYALGLIASPGQFLVAILIPGLTAGFLVLGHRWPTGQLVAAGLLEFEAVAIGLFGPAGAAFAIVLPLIAIGLVQPIVRGRSLAILFSLSAVTAVVGFAAAVFIGPAHILFTPVDATLILVAFAPVAIFALTLEWRVIRRLTDALAAAEAEIDVRDAAEDKLDRTSEILSAIVRSSPLATQAFSADRTITIWNPASERIFGWTADELIGRPLPIEMIPIEDRDGSAERIERTLAGGVANGERVRRLTKTGEERWIDIYAAPIHDRYGHSIGIAGQLVDVTERVKLDHQLLHAEKMGAVGLLASGIAHDFNNTLAAARGFAELIAASTAGSIRRDALTIVDVVDRGRQLLRQLLDLSRPGEALVEIVDLREAVAGIEPLIRHLVGPAIHLSVLVQERSAPARLRPGQLEQALINLAVNARDAMPEGGQLQIRLETAAAPDAAAPIDAGVDELDDRWTELRVTDTGSGIPEAIVGSIFEPFFTTKPIGSGTGLGLAMVRGFAENAGGRIWVESTVGSGTTFRILLPLVSGPDPAAPKPSPRTRGRSKLRSDPQPAG